MKDDLVPGIGQILYHVFKLIANALNLVVGLVFEEHIDEVWKLLQLVYLIIYIDVAVELFQSLCIFCIFRLFDDDLLAEDVAFDTETEQFHEEHLIHLHIEHRRVVGSLVGDEYGDWRQYGWSQSLTEPDGPGSQSRHSVARIVEDVEDNEHEYGDDDRESQSTLSDDGTQWGSDEEEDQAGECQRELLDSFYLVLPDDIVGIARNHCLEVEVGELLLCCHLCIIECPEFLVVRELII